MSSSIAAADCVLFLWATAPMLPQAIEVMEAWGFTYKTCAVWSKDRIGTGYWFRNKHEILLVGTRGHVPAPAMGTQWSSLILAPVGRHSEKPEAFCEMIESYFPTLPKIELHARGVVSRPGWDVWGLEAPSSANFGGQTQDCGKKCSTGSPKAGRLRPFRQTVSQLPQSPTARQLRCDGPCRRLVGERGQRR